jgi:transcription initiation factor TFIIH subunit 4
MLQYLDTVAARSMNLVECLNFLFQLSFATMGKDYSTTGLNNNMLTFLQHLREFGLVYQRKRNSGRFYPTRLALNIASGEKKGILERHREGYIVVETNYRVYAYTNSDLQVSLIGLFAEPMYRFPNLAVSLITRDSVRQAFRGGITGAQIVRFLRMHAHPKQVEEHNKIKHPVIPPTVVDQIMLWEAERNRFTFTDGVLYNQFLSVADFEKVRSFADQRGVLVWANAKHRTVVVTKDGHDPVKKFWKQQSRGQ